MSKLINLNDKRILTYVQNFERIELIGQKMFSDLSYFKSQNYSDEKWQYKGKILFFSVNNKSKKNKKVFNPFVSRAIKCFLLNQLWKNRLKNEPLSYSRVQSFVRVGVDLHNAGIDSIEKINTSTYSSIWNNISSSVGLINDFNLFIKFLDKEHVLPSNIDIISSKVVTSGLEFKALEQKMPKPELVQAIIELKNKVEAQCDYSEQGVSDLLCIYTQAFQYGLGLRLGEILRLSKDCLFYHEGKLLCRVWTEKGCEPVPRYVLGDWKELILEVHTKIIEITKNYRQYASQIDSGILAVIRERIQEYENARKLDADGLENELDLFFKAKEKEVKNSWKLKRKPNPEVEYALDEVYDYLPVGSTAKSTPSLLKAYQAWGLEINATPIGKGRNTYSVTGQSLISFVKWQKSLRAENLTQQEFLSILHGRKITRQHGRDKDIFELTSELSGGSATCYTFAPDEFKGKGRAPTTMSRRQASILLKKYAYGLLDEDEMDMTSFGRYFPELPFYYSNAKTKDIRIANPHLEFSDHKKISTRVSFEKNPDSPVRYSVTGGYAVKKASIEKYIYAKYFEINHAVLNELNDIDKAEQLDQIKKTDAIESSNQLPIEIKSRSFKTEQMVSEYLFLRAMRKTGMKGEISFVSYIPEILDYASVNYFFKGNDRYPTAFERFGVKASKEVVKEWQSHQGRHWRTTSLFRSGANKSIVNKLMGRKDAQGKHYDHNTGTERAKVIRDAMSDNVNRFIGAIPNTVAELKRKNAPQELINEVLNKELQTVSYTPEGMCTRSLELNPCEYHLRCMIGKTGNGCKHFIVDLDDPSALEPIKTLRDQTIHEIERLVELRDNTGNIAINMHLEHNLKLLKNTESVLESASNLLGNKESKELLPFKDKGSYPDDCPFQCGDK
ncbi:hypothetical protein [Shewanella woodyi]|uniref:Integrase family protein n=1 Tax=Shewanella woodyi (strain ATCC 51908 / MS32) TaxID=392500 RepID=B1KNB3_SHEWM|nr:hypothetical protein [Shewanella woodyi]ACA84610.1 conserved hypothetical protein [Shewanella woodyi ATCC 51908]